MQQDKQRGDSEMKEEKPDKNQKEDVQAVRKEIQIVKYSALMSFLVKMFEFDAIPLNRYQQIYLNDPIQTLKNQIAFYSQLVETQAQQKLNINPNDLCQFFIESQPELHRDYGFKVTQALINLKAPELLQAFEKEYKPKKFFDPDFQGQIGFSSNDIFLELKTYKDKLYPRAVISSIRKVIRMILIVETVFLLIYRNLNIKCSYQLSFGQNNVGSELPELIDFALDSKIQLTASFVQVASSQKNELGII